jgi:hypothetical protein
MTTTSTRAMAQAPLSAQQALVIARERFPNLCRGGILPRKTVGEPVDLGEIATTLAFLRRCRTTKIPNVHTLDLSRSIGVRPGAVIAAATALGFNVRSFYGVNCYAPHALIGVNCADATRVAAAPHGRC